MNRRHALKAGIGGAIGATALSPGWLRAQTESPRVEASQASSDMNVYINPARGADSSSGDQKQPLRTIAEAARRVSKLEGDGPVTVYLSEGVYAVGETANFKPVKQRFSKADRLTIRAEVLPDEAEWHTGRMPTLIHTLPLGLPGASPLEFGMLFDTSHVTIRGLKLLGAPVVETPKQGMLIRVYPIGRMGRDLDDLEISQCVFAGDKVTNPNHLGILAHGSGINVHHCLFYGPKLTVVYWTAGSRGHAMTNCVVHGAYGSGIWTTEIADDFDFRNNVIANGNYVWTYQGGALARRDPDAAARSTAETPVADTGRMHYRVVDSLLAGNKKMACSGTGASLGFKDIDASFLELVNTTVSDQPVEIELDERKREYLHPVAGSDAAKVGAGLFMSRSS